MSTSTLSTSPLTPQWPPYNPEAVTPPAGGPEGLWQDQGPSPATIDDDASGMSAERPDTPGPGLRARQAFEERYPAEGFDQISSRRLHQIRATTRRLNHVMNNGEPINGADPNNATLQEMVEDADAEELTEEDPLTLDPTQDPSLPPNLREISSLASWQVSTSKPACGVEALLSPSPNHFWQSDGPQPHLLTVHFNRWVKIVKMRVYLDFALDESYTPTRMTFWGGTGMHDLVQFAEWRGEEPRGWVDVDLEGVGVGGKAELRAFVVQVRILENHQNGKDTHVRGVQLFAKDERVAQPKSMGGELVGEGVGDGEGVGEFGRVEPEWMGEPVIR